MSPDGTQHSQPAQERARGSRSWTARFSNHGWRESVEAMARDFAAKSGVAVATHLEDVELDEAARQTVLRLLQECLANIGNYACATHVHVEMLALQDSTVVTVRDDGIGFDTARASGLHPDMDAMRSNFEASGGELCFFSTPGKGTQVVATLPRGQRARTADSG